MNRYLKVIFRWIMYGILTFLLSTLFFVVLYAFVNPPITPLMVIRTFQQLLRGEQMVMQKEWIPISEISLSLQLAVVASEDNRFLEHHGFDFEAIEKARDFNEKKNGTRMRGASTISQQTAKNVFLWPQRSWIRKGMEAYFTVLIELIWSKKRIMEVYLNVIETGNGIYGAEKASRIYFKKPALKLTTGEAALLAAILPNPIKWNPAHPTPYLFNRQKWILWNMGNIGRIEY